MDPLKLHKILLGVGVAVIVALVVALGLITKKSATLLRRRDNLRKDLSALRQKYEADTKALRATHTAQIDRSEAIVASGVASRAEIVKATEDAKKYTRPQSGDFKHRTKRREAASKHGSPANAMRRPGRWRQSTPT